MLRYHALPLLLLLLPLRLSASKPVGLPALLQVHILNAQKNNGKVVVEIYKSAADWLQAPYRRAVLTATDNSVQTTFEVPPGKYAIAIYQDANGNGKLDQNFLGILKEPIGFGNNYKPFGKPDFEAAAVAFGPTAKSEVIKLFSVL
ncbi:hypothetical protein GCM10027048_24640 [Hymenobacter coalescens]